jgi:hypothetical protein
MVMSNNDRPEGRTRDALLAEVRRRAARRRLKRRSLAVIACGLVAGSIALPLAMAGGRRSTSIRTIAPPSTSLNPNPSVTASTETTTTKPVAPTTTTAAPTTSTSSTTAPAAPATPLGPTATFAGVSGPSTWTGVEPTTIQFSADAGNIVSGIRWTSWTAQSAVGTGTWGYENCQPNCATGSHTDFPATIKLSVPSRGQFTALTEIQSGPHGQTFNYGLPSRAVSATVDVSGVCITRCPSLVIAPGSQIVMEGTCPAAATTLTIVAGATHATGKVLYDGGIGQGNGFYIPVVMPYLGEPTAGITADCQPGATTAVEANIEYTSPPAP